jgi:hypothetical protein
MDEGGSFIESDKINFKSIDMAMYIITTIWWHLLVTVAVPIYKHIDISRLGPIIIVIKNKWDWSGLATSELSSGGWGEILTAGAIFAVNVGEDKWKKRVEDWNILFPASAGLWVGESGPCPGRRLRGGAEKAVTDRPHVNT